jgi:hypothetical protein
LIKAVCFNSDKLAAINLKEDIDEISDILRTGNYSYWMKSPAATRRFYSPGIVD